MAQPDSYVPIRAAIKAGEDQEVIALIDADPSQVEAVTPFGSWLHVASDFGRIEIVRHLVQKGADVNLRAGILGGSAINEAAAHGHLEIVQYLLSVGATLDTSEPERNPLFNAIYGGHLDVVKLLLERGIDPTIKYTGQRMKDMDALAFARERGQTEIARFLAGR